MKTPFSVLPTNRVQSIPEAWLRWMPVWHAIFYSMLILATIITLTDGALTSTQHLASLVLSVALGLWYEFMIIRNAHWLRRSQPMLIYTAGALVLTLALLQIHPAYFLATYSLYGQIFGFLPLGWAVASAIVLSASLLWQQLALVGASLSAEPGLLVTDGAVTIMTILFGLWISAIVRESRGRQQLIAKLEAAQRELATVERQAGVLEERQRLAREIHDTLAQDTASIVMHLEAADQMLPVNLVVAQQHVDQARRIARESLAEARRFVWALQPELLERDSLSDAIRRVADRWSEESHIEASTTVTGTPHPLLPEIEVTLLRIAQEALTNIQKHAHASQVTLTLSYMDDLVALDVQDNGIGFEPHSPLPDPVNGGFGLAAMRKRVEQFGGRLMIESSAGEGAVLAIELPVNTVETMPQAMPAIQETS